MSQLRTTEGLIKKFAATQEFAALDQAALKRLSTDDIGAMYIECKVLRSHVFALVGAVAALEALVRTGEEVADPFEGDLERLLETD